MTDLNAGLRMDEMYSAGLRALYGRYGYRLYKVNRFEEYDLYVQNKNFLTDERVLTFTDLNGKLKALKPDITLSVVRNTRDEKAPVRVCYSESAYRVPRGETGFSEIMQTGIEYIGLCDSLVLAEIILLAEKSLNTISKRYSLDISHMGIVTEILKECGIPESSYPDVLALLRRKDRHGMQHLVSDAALAPEKAELLDRLIVLGGPAGPALQEMLGWQVSDRCREIILELLDIVRIVESVWNGSLNLDFSVLNDMLYYNGLTLSGFIDGIPSPVLAGGQYDPLLKRLGRNEQGIGFAVYLNQIDRCLPKRETPELEVLLYGAGEDPAEVFRKAEALREQGTVILERTAADSKQAERSQKGESV